MGIHKSYSSLEHPQANGQVETVNKTIKENLKKKLESLKSAWVEELPLVLQAYGTTNKTSTGETPFSIVYEVESVISVEVKMPFYRDKAYDKDQNNQELCTDLNLVEEKRTQASIWVASYQQATTRSYNTKVKARKFKKGDLVLKKVNQSTKKPSDRVLGPNWEGPYKVVKVVCHGTYQLEDKWGKVLIHPWNVEHLRKYYQQLWSLSFLCVCTSM